MCTIGNRKSYLKAFNDNGEVTKIGYRKEGDKGIPEGYSGGYAFKTAEDALRRITEAYSDTNYIVFGLDADWETQTKLATDGWWHNLQVDSKVIIMDKQT